MAECAEATVECGFCLRKGDDLEEPKVLPCTHVHCLSCLMGFYEVNQMLQCPLSSCGKVFEIPVNTLPSLTTPLSASTRCDSCTKKGDERMAIIYCTQCKRKYCTSHLESHDDVLADHDKISINDYKVKVKKLEIRECENHKGEPYSLGCKECLKMICVKCLTGLEKNCNTFGGSHELISLDELVKALVNEDIKAKMLMEEENLERLFKLISKYSAEFDVETREMVETLNKTRKEQLQAINDKYDGLEKELLEKRKMKRTEIEIFLDNEVLRNWTELRNCRLKIESRLEHAHQVDIVNGHLELKGEVSKLTEGSTPVLEMKDVVHLKAKEESRDIELEVETCDRLTIDQINGVSCTKPLVIPTSSLITSSLPANTKPLPFAQLPQTSKSTDIYPMSSNSMKLHAQPFSVCHYQNELYVGSLNKTVAKVNGDGSSYLDERFIESTGLVESVAIYNNRVYTLQKQGSTHTVHVFNMNGNQVAEWILTTDCDTNINSLSVISDHVVVADASHDRITIYTVQGSVRKRTRCQFSDCDSYIAMCAVDDNSVVISDNKKPEVFRVNIWTGEKAWSQCEINNPLGITYHEDGYVFVASFKSDTINILDVNTGAKVSTITDHKLRVSMYGLTMNGNTLVVAICGHRKLLSFKLTGLSEDQ